LAGRALPSLSHAALASFANRLRRLCSRSASLSSAFGRPGALLPSSYLSGSAAAAGIGLVNTLGTGAGGLLGPWVIGLLKERSGTYGSSMAVLAVGLLFSALVVLALGRMTRVRRPVLES
jgi:hypothetical protein